MGSSIHGLINPWALCTYIIIETYSAFTVIADFRATMLAKYVGKVLNRTNEDCQDVEVYCLKVADVFNFIFETFKNIYFVSAVYLPVLKSLYEKNSVVENIYRETLSFSIVVPAFFALFTLLVTLPVAVLSFTFAKRADLIQLKSKLTPIDEIGLTSLVYAKDIPFCDENIVDNRDICAASYDEETISFQVMRKKQEKQYKIQKYLLIIFTVTFTFQYPYVLKVIRSLLKLLTLDYIVSSSNSQSKAWLIVIYKYLSYFIFDNRFGSSCGGNLLSSVSRTGFWASLEKSGTTEQNTTEFLTDLLNNEKIQTVIWNHSLASSSLALSYSVIYHMICIYFMMSHNIFQRLKRNWTSKSSRNKLVCFSIVTFCVLINISRYFVCVKFSDEWTIFLLRLVLISVCTPTAVILEWMCMTLYSKYFECFVFQLASLLVSKNTKEYLHYSGYRFLQHCYLDKECLERWKETVLMYTSIISGVLSNHTNHQCVPVDTGSIIEMFGVPQNFEEGKNKVSWDLRTDHDVMFIMQDLIASVDPYTSLQMMQVEESLEFYHIVPRHRCCSFIKNLEEFDTESNMYKLSNQRAKEFLMENILSKVTQDQFNVAASELKPDCRSLATLSVLAFTHRFLSWTESNTQITGPAVNFKVRNAHLNPSDEWHKTVDCDFLLSFHSPSWPPSAMEWMTRVRVWPDQDTVRRVFAGGCELVPKVGLIKDMFRWRLSFSRAESFLACQVGPKPRVCYLALKIFLKRELKNVCPFVRSYHLKTLFFYFMETKPIGYWEETSEQVVFLHLLEMLSEALHNKHCPHFFIHELNLWETSDLREYVKIRKHCIQGVQFVNDSINKKNLINLFLAPKVQTHILLDDEYRGNMRGSWRMLGVVVAGVTICNVLSSPIYVILLALLLQTVTVWVIGSFCCLPLIAIFLLMFYVLKKTC